MLRTRAVLHWDAARQSARGARMSPCKHSLLSHARPALINRAHYLLSALDRVFDCIDCGWHSALRIIRCKFPGRKDGGSDQQNALASFIHFRILAVSPFIHLEARARRHASIAMRIIFALSLLSSLAVLQGACRISAQYHPQ